jgi:hypothetical protein
MKVDNPISSQAVPSVLTLREKIKKHKINSDKKLFIDKNILQKIFHPDYILFDWEYFSRELEFE